MKDSNILTNCHARYKKRHVKKASFLSLIYESRKQFFDLF